MNVFIPLLAISIGYLVGSINPAYFLTKYIKHIDIRKLGDKNAGTLNASHILGKGPAIFIAIFDLTKGIIAMGIAYWIGAPLLFIYLSGIAAIIGHLFPFYLNFRGGQGIAITLGLSFVCLYIDLINHRVPISALILVICYTLIIKFIVRKGYITAIFSFPLLAFYVVYYNYQNIDPLIIFTLFIILISFSINAFNIITKKDIFNIKPETKKEFLHWRVFLRPLTIIFPLFYFYFDRQTTLVFIGIVTLVFLTIDLSRLYIKRINKILLNSTIEIFRNKEHKKISSISTFLVACFLVVLLFEKNIAITAISFLIFGDMISKFFGLQFGQTKFFCKTLEGTLSYFLSCFLIGLLLSNFIPLSLLMIFLGSLTAAIVEILPFSIDDNFTVPIASAATMWLTKLS